MTAPLQDQLSRGGPNRHMVPEINKKLNAQDGRRGVSFCKAKKALVRHNERRFVQVASEIDVKEESN